MMKAYLFSDKRTLSTVFNNDIEYYPLIINGDGIQFCLFICAFLTQHHGLVTRFEYFRVLGDHTLSMLCTGLAIFLRATQETLDMRAPIDYHIVDHEVFDSGKF